MELGSMGALDDDDEDDYMSMIIAEPTQIVKETSIQRAARKKKESEARAFQKTKQEREADEAATREAALATSLDASNKGFKMMAKLGYKPGTALGKSEDARKEPINVNIKENRGGIGHDTEKKRKIRVEFEEAAKRIKVDEVGYRDRVRQEREEQRLAGQIFGAQKIVERLETEAYEQTSSKENDPDKEDSIPPSQKPLSTINVLWRGLVLKRLKKEAEKRRRADMQSSLSRRQTYDDLEDEVDPYGDDDDDDVKPSIKNQKARQPLQEDLDAEDGELDKFEALTAIEQLEKLVMHLRETYNYCFWCKYRYENAEMDGCPGLTEDEHG